MVDSDYSKFELTTVILYPGFQFFESDNGRIEAKPAERLVCGMPPVIFSAYQTNIKPENLGSNSPKDRYDFMNLEGKLISLTAEQIKGYQTLPQLAKGVHIK